MIFGDQCSENLESFSFKLMGVYSMEIPNEFSDLFS
jgi:hypothetical protein